MGIRLEHRPHPSVEATNARRDAVETREMHGRQREHGAQEAATSTGGV